MGSTITSCMCSLKSCPTLCDHMNYSPEKAVHGIFQARTQKQTAISFFRGSFWSSDQNSVCLGRQVLFMTVSSRKPLEWCISNSSLILYSSFISLVVWSLSCVRLLVTPDFSVLYCLLEFAQTHVHWVGDAIYPSHPLLPCFLPSIFPSIRGFV